MSALGLVSTDVRGAEALKASAPRLQLFMEDAFASTTRLWFRGRLAGVGPWLAEKQAPRRWWHWRRRPEPQTPPTLLHVHTKIGAYAFDADVPIAPDGRFEVLHQVDLPPARRGWRVARHQVSTENQTLEACNVVLEPADATRGVVAVLLPLEHTYAPGAARRLAQADRATRLTRILHDVERGEAKGHTFYYLAAVPDDAEQHQGELALAITALGWPAGSVVVLRAHDRDKASEAFEQGIDRLRWLFSGSLAVHVVNLEPSLTRPLATQLKSGADRADVARLLQGAAEQEELEKRLSGRAGSRIDSRASGVHPRRPTRGRLIPQHPVVFCHGMLAMSLLKMQLPEDRNCFAPLRAFFKDHGFRVLYPQVSPTSGVVERAAQLRDQIVHWTDEPVNLVAHSMGGLDARYMITHLGMADRVASLTTVSTPHRGTYLADWFIANFRNRVPLLLSLQALGVNVDGFRDCCLDRVREFNARTPNAPNVRYYSYAGSVSPARLTPTLRRAWTLLTPIEGPNDGMVSVASATWGEYLGTLHADHYAQTPDATFVRPGENFDHLGFYSRLVEDLARRGF